MISQVPCAKTSIGSDPTLGQRVRQVAESHEFVEALYGMGSFFRGEPHRDIDLVVVLSCGIDQMLACARAIRKSVQIVGDGSGEEFHVTVFTAAEFASAPLRDMDTLVPIFQRCKAMSRAATKPA